jgi:hypothetical protein
MFKHIIGVSVYINQMRETDAFYFVVAIGRKACIYIIFYMLSLIPFQSLASKYPFLVPASPRNVVSAIHGDVPYFTAKRIS